MGREIVYCWKCATRLQGADFDDRKAFRIGDRVRLSSFYCKDAPVDNP